MEGRYLICKGKRVVMWLRFGYTFYQKARVGDDLAFRRGKRFWCFQNLFLPTMMICKFRLERDV
jgi:hypothetical protein